MVARMYISQIPALKVSEQNGITCHPSVKVLGSGMKITS